MNYRTLFLAVSLLLVAGVNGQYKGKIKKVYDGETFWIELDNGNIDSVRLWGIDCPELGQQYGKAAQKYLESHIHREVNLEYKSRDKNKFMMAIVTYSLKNGDEVNLNNLLIEKGYAWKNKYSDDKKLEKLQEQARKKKLGLWRNSNPVPPWEWRKANK